VAQAEAPVLIQVLGATVQGLMAFQFIRYVIFKRDEKGRLREENAKLREENAELRRELIFATRFKRDSENREEEGRSQSPILRVVCSLPTNDLSVVGKATAGNHMSPFFAGIF
jgi:hypothetical protein